MASPFELELPPVGGSARARREDFDFRTQKLKTLKEKRVNTHWKPKRDILWQRNPDRVLKYRASHLHYYGWIPFAIWRNWKATVFSEVYLHVQGIILLSWMAAIHVTGLGVRDKDLATMVIMFGNPYLGGIFNYGMLVVFILGLFITLVINRWWSIRVAYTKLMGSTTDLCMVVASAVQNPEDLGDRRIGRARTEITRLLNLGHLLVIAKADAQNEEFKKSYGIRTAFRSMKVSFKEVFRNDGLTTKLSTQSTSPMYTHALFKPRNLLTFETMVSEGLMNRDEWELLNEAEKEGMPAYQMVYFWTQALLNKCRAADWIISAPQIMPLMLGKINTIVESGSSIINTINSQMPYPYVHLVSFVVHMYLIILATWFGCFLHTGRIGESFQLTTGYAFKQDDDIKSSVWMIFWCYLLMTFANVAYQGLLDMHTLLDNPFGNHCAKFPLRANVSGVTNASRAMLMMAEKLPAAFGDVFQYPAYGEEDSIHGSAPRQPASNPEFADFMNPTPTGQFPLGSIGSWRTTELDKSSRPSVRPKEKQQTEAALTDTSQPRIQQSDGTPTSIPGTAPTFNQVRGEMGAVQEGVSEGQPVSRTVSGDAVIQERFLESTSSHSATSQLQVKRRSPPPFSLMTDSRGEPSAVADGAVDVVAQDMMSTLVSLHTRADFFQLAEFNKALHKTSPGGKLARFFTKADKSHAPSVTLEQMLRHQVEPLPAPLLRSCGTELRAKALKTFSLILRFSEDRSLTRDEALEATQQLLQMGLRETDVKDELYMQLFKQMRGNTDDASRFQLWQLLHVVAATMPPSKEYVSLISHFVHEVGHEELEDEEIKIKAVKTWHALKRSVRAGARKWLPSIQEIESMFTHQKVKSVIYFLDDTCEEILYDIATTVLEAVEQIAEIIELAHYHSFSLFERYASAEPGEEFVLLDDQSYIADILSDLGQKGQNSGRLIFKKRMFRESDENITETQFLNLCYIQAQHDYLQGYYPVVYEDAAQLCALQLFSEFGAHLPGDDRVLKRSMEKFALRDVKRIRTREEWKADVMLRCTTLKCPSAEMSRFAFLSILRSLPYGQSVFFHVHRLEDPIGLLPPKLILGINSKGVHFFRPIPKEYLHSVELRDIMQFGSSHRAVFFKMRVASVLHVFQFETKHGEDICMAIQTHINDVMVKRYASMSGTPSHVNDRSLNVHFDQKMEERNMEWQREVDATIQQQEHLIQTQGNHIRERDRNMGNLQDTMRQLTHLQKEKLELSEGISYLQADIENIQSQLNESQEEEEDNSVSGGRLGVGQLVRYFDDNSVSKLEAVRMKERQWKQKMNQLRKEMNSMTRSLRLAEESHAVEIQEWNDALFDVDLDGKSRLNLHDARITSLRKEVAQLKMEQQEILSEVDHYARLRAELAELKALQSEVQRRDAVHAELIEQQKRCLQEREKLYKREQLSRKKVYNRLEDMKGKIRVYARIRSILPHEAEQRQRCALTFPDDITISHVWKRENGMRAYTFDGIFLPSATQTDVFHDTQDLIQSAVDGYNVCLFAYGQTGSGKTYTIYGTAEQPGLAPRATQHLFTLLQQNAAKLRFHVSCTMLELYQDTLKDLLTPKRSAPDPKGAKRLEIKKEKHQLVRVNGATMVDVNSAEECISAFEEGQRHRHVAATQLNIASSRSHLIMSIVIEATDLQTQVQTRGKLSFVDLAGSERNKKSGSTGEQLKEAQAINKSLSALGDVISSLERGDPYVPYRNHKLTMLMSDSLGGNAKTLMFVNVSPTNANLDETQNSLQYAMRVRSIKNFASRETEKETTSMKSRIAFWRSMASDPHLHQEDIQNMITPFL